MRRTKVRVVWVVLVGRGAGTTVYGVYETYKEAAEVVETLSTVSEVTRSRGRTSVLSNARLQSTGYVEEAA